MRTLAVVAVVILTFSATCSSFAQAVAEGAMVHANSAAATTKVGSALGNALSNVLSGSAQKMESISAAKVEHVPHASRKTLSSAKGEQSGRLVITSIRGMSKPCIAAQPSLQDASNSSDRSKTKADASARAQMAPASAPVQACGIAAGGLSPSKSVVNLSFPR
jgi:hypothetical protein